MALSYPVANSTSGSSLILQDKFAISIEEVLLDMPGSGSFVFNVAPMYSDGNTIDGTAISDMAAANSTATIVIPSSVSESIDNSSSEFRLTFALFDTESLFLRRSDERFANMVVGSLIVSATINNESITGLREPVTITLRMDEVLHFLLFLYTYS